MAACEVTGCNYPEGECDGSCIRRTVDVYIENGYTSRADYLSCLAEDYGIDLQMVQALADLFGPNEDFDGLVSSLEDMLA